MDQRVHQQNFTKSHYCKIKAWMEPQRQKLEEEGRRRGCEKQWKKIPKKKNLLFTLSSVPLSSSFTKTWRKNSLGLQRKMETEDWTELLPTLKRKVQKKFTALFNFFKCVWDWLSLFPDLHCWRSLSKITG